MIFPNAYSSKVALNQCGPAIMQGVNKPKSAGPWPSVLLDFAFSHPITVSISYRALFSTKMALLKLDDIEMGALEAT